MSGICVGRCIMVIVYGIEPPRAGDPLMPSANPTIPSHAYHPNVSPGVTALETLLLPVTILRPLDSTQFEWFLFLFHVKFLCSNRQP